MYLYFAILNFLTSGVFAIFGIAGNYAPIGMIPNFIVGAVFLFLAMKNNKEITRT